VGGRTDGLRRPEIWVNCAASADGRIAFAGGARARLSSPEDLRRVQELRARSDGIVVGVGTVEKDDPTLRVHWELLDRPPGAEPTRIVLDPSGRTPAGARVLDGRSPTIVAVSERCRREFPPPTRTVVAGSDRIELGRLYDRLYELGFRRLLVEGGARVLASVLRDGRYDRLTVYYAPWLIGDGTAPPLVAGPSATSFEGTTALVLDGVERLGSGYVATYRARPGSAVPAGT